MVFDNVFVPWEHVFIYRNLEITRDQWWKTTAHSLGNHQAQVRYVTKLRFMMGLAQRMNEMTGNVAAPPVQVMMGELAALRDDLRIHAARAGGRGADQERRAVAVPITLYSAMAMQSEFNGRMLEMVRELAGGAFITLPSSLADLENPETAPDVERYMRSASTDAKSKVALMRLLWDFIGSEFGSRHQQYEKFYGGASFIVKKNVYRNFDWKRAGALVDAALALPPIGDGLSSSGDDRCSGLSRASGRIERPKKSLKSKVLIAAAAAPKAAARRPTWPHFNYWLQAFLLYTRQNGLFLGRRSAV